MRFLRFHIPRAGTRLGVLDDGVVTDLTGVLVRKLGSIVQLAREAENANVSLAQFVRDRLRKRAVRRYDYAELDATPARNRSHLSIPLAPPEVWASGVTYLRSRGAREFETKVKGIYDLVYDAARPELFLKATANRCVGPNEAICIRSDSKWTVPEPELAIVIGLREKILGYTIGNDVSARDLEGENPLYLPQAKIYRGSCAIGPVVVTADEVADAKHLPVSMRITRQGEVVFAGETNTSQMKRSIEELVDYLHRDNPIAPGSVLLTGTGIVPPDDFALRHGDIVEIRIENIGVLRNPVRQLGKASK